MKRLLFILLCCLVLTISSISSLLAQDLSKELISVVNKNLDNIFPLTSINDAFGTKSVAVRGNVGPETATETSTDEQRNILLYSNPDGLSEYSYIEKINAGNLKNFYFEMEISPNDIYPEGAGGCYIGYINEFIHGVSVEEPVDAISLVVSDAIYLEIRANNSENGARTKLTDFRNNRIKLLIIRLTGETIFIADGKVIGTFHDDKAGPFQLRYGVETFGNGEIADCSFDNLIVRKVIP